MRECDNSKIHISSNFLLFICLLTMLDTLLLVSSLHRNTSLHFTTLHPTTLHYSYRHFTSSHLHFTILSFGLTHLHYYSIGCPTSYRTRHFFNNFTTGWRPAGPCRTTDTFLFISHTTNVLLFKFRCNIFNAGFGSEWNTLYYYNIGFV